MIKLLAPTTLERADDPSVTAIVEIDQGTLRAMRHCLEVVLDDDEIEESSGGLVTKEQGEELWRFFVRGEETP